MAAQKPTTSSSSSTAQAEILKLQNAVNFMDCLSQGGFSEIAAIAKLALRSLETPEGWNHIECVVEALNAIWSKADDVQDSITSQAEKVGCNYVDAAQRRRRDACLAAREAAGQQGAAA